MQKFTFYSPTKVIFGKDAELSTVEEIKNNNGSRVMLVYGGGSIVKSGLLDKIEKMLADANLAYSIYGGIQPNPLLSSAIEGVVQATKFGADFILAVGGGSAIDSAKAIALGTANPGKEIWKILTKEEKVNKSLPVGVILTISAAGSETSEHFVLTNDETGRKQGLANDLNRPKFAIMNPELTFTLPVYQVMCGIVDIMMHTMDRYFVTVEGNEITDEIAEALLRVVIKNGEIAVKNTHDYQSMSELMWCGSISHNGMTGLGGPGDFAPHQLSHELSAKFGAAHGASLSTVWGSWAKYCYLQFPKRFAQFANRVWGIQKDTIEETALAGIERTIAYFKTIGAPISFSELGIGVQNEEMIKELSERCLFYGTRTIGQLKVLKIEDAYKIYELANV